MGEEDASLIDISSALDVLDVDAEADDGLDIFAGRFMSANPGIEGFGKYLSICP